jgi:hypothetical protein
MSGFPTPEFSGEPMCGRHTSYKDSLLRHRYRKPACVATPDDDAHSLTVSSNQIGGEARPLLKPATNCGRAVDAANLFITRYRECNRAPKRSSNEGLRREQERGHVSLVINCATSISQTVLDNEFKRLGLPAWPGGHHIEVGKQEGNWRAGSPKPYHGVVTVLIQDFGSEFQGSEQVFQVLRTLASRSPPLNRVICSIHGDKAP